MTRVAVIGAGAAGLCAARHLTDAGVEVTIYELGSGVGGLWVYDNDNGRSPAYASLHINSEAAVSAFAGFPFPENGPLFPRHDQVRSYLEAYADHFGLRELIRFRSPVEAVERSGDRWRVVSGGAAEHYDWVVVCSGHQAQPVHPDFADRFTGGYTHVHGYRTPERYAGRRVLVIGTGNSALDVAADICTVAAETHVVARSPVLILPRLIMGVPSSRVIRVLDRPQVPWPLRRAWRNLLVRIAHGPMERWGLRTPRTRTHPATHPTLMTHVAYGRVLFRPGVAAVEGVRVTFDDGTEGEYDEMIAATGYAIDLPFLPPGMATDSGRRLDLFQRVFPPDHPGLAFVGYFNVSGGSNISMMDTQSELLTAVVTGRVSLPSPKKMHERIERDAKWVAKRYPASPRYGLELDPVPYRASVRRFLARATTRGPIS